MFGFIKRLFVKDPDQQVAELNATIASLREQIKQQNNTPEHQAADAEFGVDWRRIRAFTIERLVLDDGRVCTVIGHLVETAGGGEEPQEWHLFCNDATHSRLVSEFNQNRVN